MKRLLLASIFVFSSYSILGSGGFPDSRFETEVYQGRDNNNYVCEVELMKLNDGRIIGIELTDNEASTNLYRVDSLLARIKDTSHIDLYYQQSNNNGNVTRTYIVTKLGSEITAVSAIVSAASAENTTGTLSNFNCSDLSKLNSEQ